MAFQKRNVKYYAKRVAKENGLSQDQVNQLLGFAMRNVMAMIKGKEDIRMPGVGRLWIDKPHKPKTKKRKHGGHHPGG